MQRIKLIPRENYKTKLEDLSFQYHSLDNVYWDETACYKFNSNQVDQLEKATNDLFNMCLEAVQHVIDNDLYDKLHINRKLVPLIERSWNEEEASVYGRFDFGYDGINPPKMLEFNADTPTSLYEASVVQWYWLEDVFKGKDQFNSIHEKLIAYWRGCVDYFDGETVHFTSLDNIEDYTTVEYLRDTAFQGGLNTKYLAIDQIGWDADNQEFVGLEEETIQNIFKLYPWEWLIHEKFGDNIISDQYYGNYSPTMKTFWNVILTTLTG